jgi:hypothetical protein
VQSLLRRAFPLLLPLAAALQPSPTYAGLDTSFVGVDAGCFGVNQHSGPIATPHPGGGLDVSVGATATNSVELGPLYTGDFGCSAAVLGAGFLDCGFGSANLDVMAESKPEKVESIPPGNPAFNGLEAAGFGAVDLRFSEVGVVTGGTPGAPVTLTLHVGVVSTSIAVGGIGSYPHIAKASMYARVIDNDGGFVGIDRTARDNQIVDFAFDTAVGHHLSIEGSFRAEAEGRAGPPAVGMFVPQFFGEVHEAAGGFWIDVPPSVGFDAPSLVDYTVNPLTVRSRGRRSWSRRARRSWRRSAARGGPPPGGRAPAGFRTPRDR